ncbi:MAG: PQQ-binding-like beta-propeller repeat protein [Chloroflexaceae bacterium]
MRTVHEWLLHGRTPARHTFTPETVSLPLRLAWQTQLDGAILSAPTYTRGSVYVCSLGGIYRLNAQSGDILWHHPCKGVPSPRINGFKTSPTLWVDRIYCTDTVGTIYCLDQETGQMLWETDYFAASDEEICSYKDTLFTRYTQPTGEEFVHGYACLDPNGEIIWMRSCSAPVCTYCAIAADNLIFGDVNGQLYAWDTTNGMLRWQTDLTFPTKNAEIANTGTPAIKVMADGMPVIVDDMILINVTHRWTFCGLDLATGAVQWAHVSNGVAPLCQATDAQRMYYMSPGFMRYLDIRTGAMHQVNYNDPEHERFMLAGSGIVVDTCYFTALETSERILVFDTTSGSVLWEFKGKGGFRDAGIFVDGSFIIGNNHGIVYCFVTA